MKALKTIQTVLIIIAAILLIWGILTGMGAIPNGILLLTLGGLQRMVNTLLLFSIALGIYMIATKKD